MNNNFKVFYWGPCLTFNSVPEEFMKTVDVLYENACIEKIPFSQTLGVKFKSEYYITDNNLKTLSNILNPFFQEYLHFYNNTFTNSNRGLENPRLITSWINNQQQHEFRPPHKHDFDMSFILYVDVPEELKNEYLTHPKEHPAHPGEVVFNYCFDNSCSEIIAPNTNFSFLPKRGDLFIFPNYLVHYSMPFVTSCIRKSISGNISIESFVPTDVSYY